MNTSIIIPCYNEEKNLPYLITKLELLLEDNSCEVILVNNGSKDNTESFIKEIQSKYNNLRSINLKINKGYGYGILQGLKIAKGELVAWTHSDMQTNPMDILKGKKFFIKNNKKVFVKGLRKGRPLLDRFFTISMSIYSSILLRKALWDINAQPTIFPRSFINSWQNPPNDFSLDLYAYYQAKKEGYLVYRFPVKFKKRLFGVSNWNINIFSKIKFIIRNIKYINKLLSNS